MKLNRKFTLTLALLITTLYTLQMVFQIIPKISLFHTNNGTECTCGCIDYEASEDTIAHCTTNDSMMICLCEDNHEKRAEFPAQQFDIFFIIFTQSMVHPPSIDEFVTPSIQTLSSIPPEGIFHPPQA